MTPVRIHSSWQAILQDEFNKSYFQELVQFVKGEYASKTVFPPAKSIFAAFDNCPLDTLKVVIIGQDPYHTPGVANGLAFSANKDNKIPPSLQNIFKEIISEYGGVMLTAPDLTFWAKQGVLLLNTTLTVLQGQPMSHKDRGWETFTDAVIKKVSDLKTNLVFMLWGAHAQKKQTLINSQKHLILTSPHPSPFSVSSGFFGNGHFKSANKYLNKHNSSEIKWLK